MIHYQYVLFFSDISVQLQNRVVPAHKLVLNARSSSWGEVNLCDVDILGTCKFLKECCS